MKYVLPLLFVFLLLSCDDMPTRDNVFDLTYPVEPVTDLTVSVADVGVMILNWSYNGKGTEFRIDKKTANGNWDIAYSLLPGSSRYFFDTQVSLNTLYTYRVYALADQNISTAVEASGENNRVVATPLITPPGGSYDNDLTVTIECATIGATIRYTMDGSEPTENSSAYSSPLAVTQTMTVRARAYRQGRNPSVICSTNYQMIVATPTFSPEGGAHNNHQVVTISCATIGATIRYTLDDSEPTETSSHYTSSINISSTTTLKARAFKTGWTPSSTVTATYIHVIQGFILIPGGMFTMGRTTGNGDSNELPMHAVTLNPFYIGKYEVTQAEWQAVMGSNPSHFTGNTLLPVEYISWNDLVVYCNLRSMNEGLTPVYSIIGSTNPASWGAVPTSNNTILNDVICNWSANGYRLPTEAEWEYAARAATNTPDYLYAGSDDIGTVAWYSGNSGSQTHAVGQKSPNGIGTYDMSGNVWEWCWDWYGSYPSTTQNNPHGPDSGSIRVLRGGSGYIINADDCRVANRNWSTPDFRHNYIGFRLCRSAR